MDIVLIAGLWLDGSAWDDVLPELEALGHRPVSLTLPGQGDGAARRRTTTRWPRSLAAVDAADGSAARRRPLRRVRRWRGWRPTAAPRRWRGVVLIGGFPSDRRRDLRRLLRAAWTAWCRSPGGSPSRARTPTTCRPSSRRRSRPAHTRCRPGSPRARCAWTDERRHGVPLTLVCPEFTPEQAREWIEHRRRARARATRPRSSFVDIDSGHWPMFTQPARWPRCSTRRPAARSRRAGPRASRGGPRAATRPSGCRGRPPGRPRSRAP